MEVHQGAQLKRLPNYSITSIGYRKNNFERNFLNDKIKISNQTGYFFFYMRCNIVYDVSKIDNIRYFNYSCTLLFSMMKSNLKIITSMQCCQFRTQFQRKLV